MDQISAALTIKALDGLYARSAVTAENIANAGTPGYRPLRVSFEDALSAAARGQGPLEAARAKVDYEPRPADDPGLRLDLELANASTTSMRYAALIDVLSRQMQLQSLATTGN